MGEEVKAYSLFEPKSERGSFGCIFLLNLSIRCVWKEAWQKTPNLGVSAA